MIVWWQAILFAIAFVVGCASIGEGVGKIKLIVVLKKHDGEGD